MHFHFSPLFQIVVSGLRGTFYPDDLLGQKLVFKALLDPIVHAVLGPGVEFDLLPRRRFLRGNSLPPCEVNLRTCNIASRFKSEGARLSKSRLGGLAGIFFYSMHNLVDQVVFFVFLPLFILTSFCFQGPGGDVACPGQSRVKCANTCLLYV